MKRVPAVLAAVLLIALPVAADQVADELRAALQKWEKGDAPGAHDHVRMADSKMSELEARESQKAWGEVAGYTLELGDSMSMGGAMLGGGITSSATYTDTDGNTINGTVVANSPLLGMISGLLSNSFMATASGASIERVAGRKAALQQEGDHWTGNMPYKSTVLITVNGPTKEDVVKVYEAFRYDVIDATLILEQ
jgi:hypothetical protein